MPEKNKKKQRGFFADTWHRLCKRRLAVLGMIVLVIFALLVIFADQIAPYPYDLGYEDVVASFTDKDNNEVQIE